MDQQCFKVRVTTFTNPLQQHCLSADVVPSQPCGQLPAKLVSRRPLGSDNPAVNAQQRGQTVGPDRLDFVTL